MSLEYLESEEKEEYITIREKRIADTTMRALEDLLRKVNAFKRMKFNKTEAIRFIDNMNDKHYELIVEETEFFRKNVTEYVNNGIPINYQAIEELITSTYKTNSILSKKKVALTPDEELKYEQYLQIYL